MPNANFVTVITSLEAPSPAPLNYIPICAFPADSPPFVEAAKTYSSVQALLDDGFITTDPAVLMATQVFGQGSFAGNANIPTRFVVIAKGVYVAQVVDVGITGTTNGDYEVYVALLGGGAPELVSTFTASGNTATQIRDGLIANWAGTEQTPSAQGGTTLRITADVAGAPFVVSTVGPGLTPFGAPVTQTANVGPYEDMDAAWLAAPFYRILPNPAEAYGLVLEWSRWAEGTQATTSKYRCVCDPQLVDSDIKDAVEPNTASILVALNRKRTFPVVHVNTSDRMTGARAGRYAGYQPPGVKGWHFGELGGTSLTTTIIYTVDEGENLKAAQVGWIERDVPDSPVRTVWNQGSGDFFVEQVAAEDYWWLSTKAAIEAKLDSGFNLDAQGIAELVAAINAINLELAAAGILDITRTTVTPVPLADVPAAELAVGQYTTPNGGIEVSTVLIPKGRSISVSAVFATA